MLGALSWNYGGEQTMHDDETNADQTKLTLVDLIVWIICCTLLCCIGFVSFQSNLSVNIRFVQVFFFVPILLIYPVGMTAAIHFGLRWLKQEPIDFQPGHWLLCLIAVMGVSYLVSQPIMMVIDAMDSAMIASRSLGSWYYGLSQFVFVGVFVAVGFLLPVVNYWRLALLPRSLMSMMLGLMWLIAPVLGGLRVLNVVQPLLLISEMTLLVVLTVVDGISSDKPRDWLHWAGVIATFCLVPPTLFLLLARFFGVPG